MKALDVLRPALRQFRTQRLQALLISVAIALGVGVVVAVAALAEAGNESSAQFSNSLTAREVKVSSAASGMRRGLDDRLAPVRLIGETSAEPLTFTVADLAALKEALPGVNVYIDQTAFLMLSGGQGFDASVSASRVTADYFAAANLNLVAGSFFTESDYQGDGNVMVVTTTFLEEREIAGDPIGQEVEFQFDGIYRIVGVVEDPGSRFSRDRRAYLPLTPIHVRSNDVNLELTAVAETSDGVADLTARVDEYARNRWGGRAVVTNVTLQTAQSAGANTTLLLIAGFASLGLLIAALNIMNLMLARVLKRYREIGIQRSLGASRRIIATQVLFEALVLGAVGGVLGLAAGYGLIHAYHSYLDSLSAGLEVTSVGPSLRLVSSLLGVGLALVVSLVFGLYPAAVATRVKPVTALRSL